MKKLFFIMIFGCLFLLSGCKEIGDSVKDSTQSIATEITSTVNESTEAPNRTADEDLIQKHIEFLSEELTFGNLESGVQAIAVTLEYSGVKELKELTIVEEFNEYAIICIKDATNQIYYLSITTSRYCGRVMTEKQWELVKEHRKILSQKFVFKERTIEGIAETLMSVDIQKIKNLVVESNGENNTPFCIRIEDITDSIYYLNLNSLNGVALIFKDSIDGEIIYSSIGS